jgi:hypothetical protein
MPLLFVIYFRLRSTIIGVRCFKWNNYNIIAITISLIQATAPHIQANTPAVQATTRRIQATIQPEDSHARQHEIGRRIPGQAC